MTNQPGQANDIQLRVDDLSPFLVVVLFRNEDPIQAEEQEHHLRTMLVNELEWYQPEYQRVIQSMVTEQQSIRDGHIGHTIIYYTECKEANWTRQDEIRDFINHIVILSSWNNFSALYCSDNELKGSFVNYLLEQDYQGHWPKPIEKNRLNAIFVNGPARTLWLAGIHKRRSIRADSKVLMGANIRDTLNPLDDQSYYFTSARSYQRDWDRTTGVSPNKSQIWIRKTQSWNDYRNLVNDVLLRLADNYDQIVENPFPILATPLTNLDMVHTAYDVNFLYPEILAEDAREEDQNTIHLLEDLSYNSSFNVVGDNTSPNFEAQLIYNGQTLGNIQADFQNTLDNRNAWRFEYTPVDNRMDIAEHLSPTNIRRFIRRGKFLQIRFESGHTFSSGEFFLQRFTDYPFTGWQYVDFDGYEIDREKPSRIDRIGLDHSLFCWVWNENSANSWLYCDDRSGEVADFIKFRTDRGAPEISLIHVKAAQGGNNRRFSVSAYEVVTAQAIKNLRHFEIENLINQFAEDSDEHFRYRIKHNGLSPTNDFEAGRFRDEFVRALRAIGTNFKKEVVIIQPHNRQSSIVRGNGNHNARCQLHTLLLSAETACRSLGADFHAITDQN